MAMSGRNARYLGVRMMRTFLVDDSLYVRQRLARILSQLKEVEIVGEATEANEATQAIQRLKPDVVLLDIQLTGETNGIDVLKSVKRAKPAPIVIILTNYPYPQYRKKCLDAGADFFFDKSTQFEKVVPVIEQLLGRRGHPHSPGLNLPI